MNKLWIFGDSYSTYNRERGNNPLSIYTNLCDELNFEQNNMAISGLSNSDIFTNLIKFLIDYKKGDVIIFQLSFLDRFSYINLRENRILNDHEKMLCSFSDKYFIHPQYYHSDDKSNLTETQFKAFNIFLENNFYNLFDSYYKFFNQLKHIINFLEKNEINFKLIILEDRDMDYNGSSINLLHLLRELKLDKYILPIGDRLTIKKCKFYIEKELTYEYHHFSLQVIDKIGEEIKKSFVNEFKI